MCQGCWACTREQPGSGEEQVAGAGSGPGHGTLRRVTMVRQQGSVAFPEWTAGPIRLVLKKRRELGSQRDGQGDKD